MAQRLDDAWALRFALRIMRMTEGETAARRLVGEAARASMNPETRGAVHRLADALGERNEAVAAEILMGVGRVLNHGAH